MLADVLKLGQKKGGAIGADVGLPVGYDGSLETKGILVGSTDNDVEGVDDGGGICTFVTNISVKSVKLILPRPVTGSKPGPAVNPELQQVALPPPDFTQHLL